MVVIPRIIFRGTGIAITAVNRPNIKLGSVDSVVD